jgi:hypothetical protein
VILTASSSEGDVVSRIEVDFDFGQHGIILNLTLSNWGTVIRDEDQFGFGISDALQC